MRYAFLVGVAISRPALCAVMLLVGCGGREGGATVGNASGGAVTGTATGTSGGSGASVSGAACADQPTTLVQSFWSQPQISAGQVGGVVVTETDVYFTLSGPSSLWRVPIGGGQPTMVMSITGGEDAMLATPTSLVIAESSEGMNAGIVRLSLADMSVSPLALTNGSVSSLISDGVDVYFSDNDGAKSVPLTGGSVQTLSSQQGTLGLEGSNVLVADGMGGNIFSMPKSGGALTPLATNQPGARFPMACGTDVCWMNSYPCAGVPAGDGCVAGNGEGAIVRLSTGGAPVTLAQDQSLYYPGTMVFDGSDFFVVNVEDASPDGELTRVPASGGTPVALGTANSIAITGGCLFAIDYRNGVYSEATSYLP